MKREIVVFMYSKESATSYLFVIFRLVLSLLVLSQ